MNVLFTLIKKNFKLLIRSKFSALIILIGPLLIMLLTGLAFNNTNIYNINIGIFSENYTEITDSFIEKLRIDQFTVLKTLSEGACVDKIKEGHFHICIIFPKETSLNQESQNQITFYVDYSRINLVWMVIDTISSKISERSSELSLNLTTSIIDILQETELELSGKEESIKNILENNWDSLEELETLTEKLNLIDISFDEDEFTLEEISSENNQLEILSDELKEYGENKTEESITLLKEIETEVNGLNISDSEKNAILLLTTKIDTHLDNLNDNITDTKNSLNNISEHVTDLLDTISENIDSLKSRLNLAAIDVSEIIIKIETIEDKLNLSRISLLELQTSIKKIQNSFSSIQIKNATTIVNPTTTNIKPISTEKSHLNYFFPSLISLVIMFIAILLGSSLVMMEKTSRAYFRNFISPTNNITFFFSTYITCMIVMSLQLIVLFIISLSIFNIPISIFSSNFLSILLLSLIIATLFTLLGMSIGYAFTSRETATFGAISISSILFILSDLILPIESMPTHLLFLAKLNPFMISSTILRKVILFNKSIFSLGNHLYLLLFYITLLLVISLFFIGFLKRNYFIKLHSKLIMKRKRK